MSAARRMKAPVTKATPRVEKKAKTKAKSTNLPCVLAVKGCKHNRTKGSSFCYGHGRRIDDWAGRPEYQRKERIQDLDRYRAFQEYASGNKGAN